VDEYEPLGRGSVARAYSDRLAFLATELASARYTLAHTLLATSLDAIYLKKRGVELRVMP
jgi:hypothetical protein